MEVTNHDASDRQFFKRAEPWPRGDRAAKQHARTNNEPTLIIYDVSGGTLHRGTPWDIPEDLQDDVDRIRMDRMHVMLFGTQAKRDRLRRPTPKGMAEPPTELLSLSQGPGPA